MIEKKLREYKSNLSKLHLIECEMQRIENDIQLADPSYIKATAFDNKGAFTTGTPRVGKGAWNENIGIKPKQVHEFNSVVEDAVFESEKNREEVDRLKAVLWDMVKDRMALKFKIDYVNALLDGLTAEERFVIESFYFDRLTWPMIADRYRKEYGIYKSIRPLKYKRDDALKKLSENSTVLALK